MKVSTIVVLASIMFMTCIAESKTPKKSKKNKNQQITVMPLEPLPAVIPPPDYSDVFNLDNPQLFFAIKNHSVTRQGANGTSVSVALDAREQVSTFNAESQVEFKKFLDEAPRGSRYFSDLKANIVLALKNEESTYKAILASAQMQYGPYARVQIGYTLDEKTDLLKVIIRRDRDSIGYSHGTVVRIYSPEFEKVVPGMSYIEKEYKDFWKVNTTIDGDSKNYLPRFDLISNLIKNGDLGILNDFVVPNSFTRTELHEGELKTNLSVKEIQTLLTGKVLN